MMGGYGNYGGYNTMTSNNNQYGYSNNNSNNQYNSNQYNNNSNNNTPLKNNNNYTTTGGGGGFTPSNAFDMSSSQQDGNNKRGPNTLRALTIKQLLNNSSASGNNSDDRLNVDHEELGLVTLVGRIHKKESTSTSINFSLDDGSAGGLFDLKKWVDPSADQEFGLDDQFGGFEEGSCVKVIGNVTSPSNGKPPHLQIKKMSLIRSPDEIAYHLLNVAYQHLHFTQGPLSKLMAQHQMKNNAGSMNPYNQYQQHSNNNNNNSSHYVGGAHHQQQHGNNMGNPMIMGGGDQYHQGDNNFTRVQNAIMKIIHETPDANAGASFQDITYRLRSVAGEQDIRNDIDFLSNEGHIFNTIDEDHFRASNI